MIYETKQDVQWLRAAYDVIEQEYNTVWMGTEHPHNRRAFKGLSRYYHADKSHRGGEDESGWDYTDRFDDRALDYAPIDLNSFLYKYETDLSNIAGILHKAEAAQLWVERSVERRRAITDYMWNRSDGFFYDYDFANGARGDVKSLAAYVTLFTEVATIEQAKQLVDNLELFQTPHGLTNTPKTNPPIAQKQWTSPNGWAPLHYIVVEGLEKYGYEDEAAVIRAAWVQTVENKFKETGLVFEKYNVVNPSHPPTSAVYPDQFGFAWSNAVTAYFASYKRNT